MATVTKPIALDESINTTEQTPRNIADVLAEELKGIADNILPPNASQIAYDNTASGLTATNVQDAIDEVISSQADVIADTMADLTENKTATVTDGVADFETIDGSLVKSLVVEIEPSQSGSGTPSPSNIRPISGYTQEDVTVVGKNLAEYDNANNPNRGAFNYSSDTAESLIATRINAGGAFLVQFRAYVIAGKTYTFSFGKYTVNGTEQSDVSIYIYSDRLWGTVIKANLGVTKTGSKWVSTYTGEIVFGLYDNYGNHPIGTIIELEKFQVEKGSTATAYEPYHGKTYTTPFNQTVYGGTLDVLTGELTINSVCVNMEDLNYSYNAQNNTFGTSIISDMADFISSEIQVKCSALGGISPKSAQGMAQAVDNSIAFNNSTANKFLRIKCTTYTDAETFKTAMTGQRIVYEIATPTTLSLTPQTVKALVGENHISASTGDVLECKFSMLINGDDLEMLLS